MKDKSVRWGLPILVVLIAMPAVIHDTFFLRVITEAIMWIGLAIAFDVIAGYTGYLNFGHGDYSDFGSGDFAGSISRVNPSLPMTRTDCPAGMTELLRADQSSPDTCTEPFS